MHNHKVKKAAAEVLSFVRGVVDYKWIWFFETDSNCRQHVEQGDPRVDREPDNSTRIKAHQSCI